MRFIRQWQLLVTLVIAASLSGCIIVPPANDGGASTQQGSQSSSRYQADTPAQADAPAENKRKPPVESEAMADGYDLGREKGYQDGHAGLSRTPTRHANRYTERDRAEFMRGYKDGYNAGIKVEAPAPADYGQPLIAVNGQGQVVVKEGERTVAICKTALPNIEETRFIDEQNHIVIKSRGGHGPAMVELFASYTGELKGSYKAYEINDSSPEWTRGMGE